MRHENHPGGSGTRLLLNAALWTGMPAVQHVALDTAVQFSFLEPDGTTTSYFLKVQTAWRLAYVSAVCPLCARCVSAVCPL